MQRVVSLFLPTWPTDRLRRRLGAAAPPPEAPLVLVGRDGRRRVVTAANTAARALGLHPGMPATQAQALVPGLLTHDADPKEDEAALERLALWALKLYSPVVAADPPDGLMIDASGAAHLHGGEACHARRPGRAAHPCRDRGPCRHGRDPWCRPCARPLPGPARRWSSTPMLRPVPWPTFPSRRFACLPIWSPPSGASGSTASASWQRNHGHPWRCGSGRSPADGSTRPMADWPSR